jgi:hypothetical protein
LNERFPEIQPLTVRQMLIQYWGNNWLECERCLFAHSVWMRWRFSILVAN